MAEDNGQTNGEETTSRPQFRRRETPAVLHSFPSLKRGQQELKIRVLQYPRSEPILDIREFVTSEEFNGFTKKGLSLDFKQVIQLRDQLPNMLEALENV